MRHAGPGNTAHKKADAAACDYRTAALCFFARLGGDE